MGLGTGWPIRTIEVTPPDLHVGQIDVIKSLDENRYTIVCAGRRWGKSTLSLVSSVDQALKGLKVWLIFPVYPQSLETSLNLKSLIRQLPEEYVEIREVEKRIVLQNGGSIQIKSSNKPESLREAGGISLVIFDEAAYMDQEHGIQFVQYLLQIVLVKHYLFLLLIQLIGFLIYLNLLKEEKDWKVFHFQTSDNPRINPEELDQARTRITCLHTRVLIEFTEVGNMFKREWFKYYEETKNGYLVDGKLYDKEDLSIYATMDTALSVKETADYSVIMVVGTTEDGKLLVLDVFRKRLGNLLSYFLLLKKLSMIGM